jgi:hypothetical protein
MPEVVHTEPQLVTVSSLSPDVSRAPAPDPGVQDQRMQGRRPTAAPPIPCEAEL